MGAARVVDVEVEVVVLVDVVTVLLVDVVLDVLVVELVLVVVDVLVVDDVDVVGGGQSLSLPIVHPMGQQPSPSVHVMFVQYSLPKTPSSPPSWKRLVHTTTKSPPLPAATAG